MVDSSLLNCLINHLPFELHLPGYNYCGPGTKLTKRLIRGDRGINLLDEYCKQHDVAYNKSSSLIHRHKADIKLMKMARKRAQSSNASLGEKFAANLVNKAMLAKVSNGCGLKGSKLTKKESIKTGVGLKKHFKKIVSHTRKHLQKLKPKCKKMAIELAIAAAKESMKDSSVKLPRMIPIPKTGGILPLIPIFAGLSAVGSLAGGAAAITKVINEFKAAKKQFAELKRHNEKMEGLCIGRGLEVKPYNKGFGIFISNKKN